MPSLLEQLDNDSILLLYATGELSARDAGDVERMLANDARLRAKLEELRVAYHATGSAIREADAQERIALSAGTASRRVGQAVRAWHARREAEPGRAGAVSGPRRLRFPWWSYPVAAVAAIVIGAVSWWGFQSEGGLRQKLDPLPTGVLVLDADGGALENDPNAVAAGEDGIERTWESYEAVSASVAAADADLDAAEDELFALLEPDMDGSVSIFLTGGDAGETGETDAQ